LVMPLNFLKSIYNRTMAPLAVVLGLILFISFMMNTPLSAQEIGLPGDGDPLVGHKIFFDKRCVTCHSIYGNGGKTGRDLGNTLRDLEPAGIFSMMWNHTPEMGELMQQPSEMALFSEQEMKDFIAFIYFLKYLDEPGESTKGAIVLKQNKCLACHSVSEEEQKTAPQLNKVKNYANPLALAQDMWNHGPKMTSEMSAAGIPWPKFNGSDMVDLFAYLKQISTNETNIDTYLRPGRATVGEALFEKKGCFLCHKIGDKGKIVGPDLTKTDYHAGATQIVVRLWQHGPKIWGKMAQMGIGPIIFKENELADITAYIYSLNYIKQTGNYETGKRLFVKKSCAKCHPVRGEGDHVGPDLARSDKTMDYMKITAAMWNHNQKMRTLMDKMDVSMPRFKQEEMKDLFFYLRTERLKNEF
jgi:cytochrome c2